MGQSSTETVKEIEEIRGRLEDEIKELEDRLPSPARWVKRLAGVAVGGGVAGFVFWKAVGRFRGGRKAKRRVKRSAPAETVLQVVPERWAVRVEDALQGDRLKTLAGAAAAAWLILRLAELRQLRRVNRALIAGR
jgi:hypothetical protein